ncbi:MAG: protein kinase domain-containing protein [Polyangiaceae bacterium]
MRSVRPSARSIAPPPPPSGELLAGKYRVESMIGEGGMGTVLAAHHELLDLPVAVKLLSPNFVRNGPMVERFLREARAAARLKSEHVARVTDVGTLETGQPYIVMELLQGEDLEQRRERLGRLPVREAVDVVLQALEAMAQAHAAGIVHRDLKPANLFLALLPDGREVVKVLDFGIAKLIDVGGAGGDARSLTGEHALGSPSYMAPEQIRNASQIDHRVDIWALGVILFDLLTGQLPFRGETVGEIFGNVLVGSAPAVRSLRPEVSAELEATVGRCLQREPERRFADTHELARALAPHGSGMWSEYVARIAQTLARGGAPQKQEDTAVRRSPYLHPASGPPARVRAAQGERVPKEVERASMQETLVANAIESVRVPAPASRRRTFLVASGGALIAGFAALAVVRPRAATQDSASVATSTTPPPTPSATEAAGASTSPTFTSVPLASATASGTTPPAPGSAARLRPPAPAPGKPVPHRPAKRPGLLDSPD